MTATRCPRCDAATARQEPLSAAVADGRGWSTGEVRCEVCRHVYRPELEVSARG